MWTFSSYDSHGEPTVIDPVEIDTHWESGLRERMGENDNPIAISGTILVDRDIALNSILWLGELVDLPASPTNLVEVVDFDKIPDDKGRKFQRTVFVKKWKEDLPTVG